MVLDGFPLPDPGMSEEAVFAWAAGFLAGWEHGEREGHDRAFREADDLLAQAIANMLGGWVFGDDSAGSQPQWTRAEAVHRHLATMDARERRRRHGG